MHLPPSTLISSLRRSPEQTQPRGGKSRQPASISPSAGAATVPSPSTPQLPSSRAKQHQQPTLPHPSALNTDTATALTAASHHPHLASTSTAHPRSPSLPSLQPLSHTHHFLDPSLTQSRRWRKSVASWSLSVTVHVERLVCSCKTTSNHHPCRPVNHLLTAPRLQRLLQGHLP